MDIMTFFTKCHATLLAMWISERNAEKWRANIGAPIGACHETTLCVGRNQEVPVEQIIIFIGSVTHGPSSIVWRHVTIGKFLERKRKLISVSRRLESSGILVIEVDRIAG